MTPNQITIDGSFLSIQWKDGSECTHYIPWLIDNAINIRHEKGQKLNQSKEIDLSVSLRSVEFDDTYLKLYIDNNADIVKVKLSWLCNFKRTNAKKELKYWDCTFDFANHRVDYNQLITDKSILAKWLQDVETYGVSFLKNVPKEDGFVTKIVELFGFVKSTNYGKYYSVQVAANPDNLADSALALPLHTDNPYRYPTPTLQLLHCLESAIGGGETTLADGFAIADYLRNEYPTDFDVLSSSNVRFEYSDEKNHLENRSPLITLDTDGAVVGVKFNSRSVQAFDLPTEEMEAFYKAYQLMENTIDSDRFTVQFKLETGDLILYNNERILHGRTAYNAYGNRLLQGCYADIDSLKSKLAVLNKSNDLI